MPNIEIKAHYGELEKARGIARRIGAKHLGLDHQVDTYFFTKQGRLKLRESSMSGAMLIPYLRCDSTGPKKSSYTLLDAKEPALAKTLLSQTLGVETVVEKHRDIYLYENVRIHLDEVRGLGRFLEFEAVYRDETPESEGREHGKIKELIKVFEISDGDLIEGSYRERKPGQP